MPLVSSVDCGTSAGGSVVEEYCRFCFREGCFTAEHTLDEMIRVCSEYVDFWNQFSGRNYTKKQAVLRMQSQFPLLRRWAQKENTQNEYYKAISRVLSYMHAHLNGNSKVEKLAEIACISPYHLHRIFSAVVGETIGQYGVRLRMEYVAVQLQQHTSSLELLADVTGYSGTPALSKAFRKFFGMTPSAYRSSGCVMELRKHRFEMEIRQVEPFCIACAPVSGGNFREECERVWQQLNAFVYSKDLFTEDCGAIGLSLDAHDASVRGRHLFYACLPVKVSFAAEYPYASFLLDGGKYAVFSLKGSYERLTELYRYIYFEWLPSSNYTIRPGYAFEKYLDNPLIIAKEDTRTEVYLPVKEIVA